MGLLLLTVTMSSLPEMCLIGPANCAALKQIDSDLESRCRRFRDVRAVLAPACDHGRGDNCLELADLIRSCVKDYDAEHVLDLYIHACARGEAIACMRAGQRASAPASRNSWYQRAFAIYEKDCAKGRAVACNAMSYWLYDGMHGVERDHVRAAELAAQSCEMGLTDVCYRAAMLFEQGPGTIEVDEKRAAALLRLGCPHGSRNFWCRRITEKKPALRR